MSKVPPEAKKPRKGWMFWFICIAFGLIFTILFINGVETAGVWKTIGAFLLAALGASVILGLIRVCEMDWPS